MKPIFIFRHWHSEGPGYLTELLTRANLPWRLIALDAGDQVPDNPSAAAALIFMGGPMSVNDNLNWITPELNLIRNAHTHGVPMLGHCLGAQLIAKAMGGIITRNSVPEIGWLPVTCTNNEAAVTWFSDLPKTFEAFHWHSETFSLPATATLILSSEHCTNQGFVVSNTLALQCHIEVTTELVNDWVANSDEINLPSLTVQSASAITNNLVERIKNLNHIADKIYGRWLNNLITTN